MRRQQRNLSVRSKIKTVVKKVELAVIESNPESAKTTLSEAFSALDSAAAKGIIKKNTASRKKSRLARKVNSVGST